MPKKAQVTAFIIVGVSFVLAMVFAFFLRNSIIEAVKGEAGTRAILNNKMNSIERKIYECIEDLTVPAIKTLAKQGGTFNNVNYIVFNGDKIEYLCEMGEEKGINHPLLLNDVASRLENYLQPKYEECISLEDFRTRGIEMDAGEMKTNITIKDKQVVVEIVWPISLERKGIKVEKEKFVREINLPLGKLIEAANDVLNTHCFAGAFNPSLYSISHNHEFAVLRYYVGKNVVYKVLYKDTKYDFPFQVGIKNVQA